MNDKVLTNENVDAVGNPVYEGDTVCVLTAGNFIYGHVAKINDKGAEVLPDIGYRTSKKNFRLKQKYTSRLDHLVKFNYKNSNLALNESKASGDVTEARQE